MKNAKPPCPVCWHTETIDARQNDREDCRDDAARLRWCPSAGGARGQQITRWDGGWWLCETCGISLTPRDAGTLVDAALMISIPDCDSVDEKTGLHGDTLHAFRGGQ